MWKKQTSGRAPDVCREELFYIRKMSGLQKATHTTGGRAKNMFNCIMCKWKSSEKMLGLAN